MLENIKELATQEGAETVEDEITFSNHKAKLEMAETEINALARIKLYKFPEYTYPEIGEFGEAQDVGDFLSEDNRLKLLLVDYDEGKNQWIEGGFEIPLSFSVKEALDSFKKDLQKWKEVHLK